MASPESVDEGAAAGLRCSVCASPVETPVRGTPLYRKLLACKRAGVCPTHLTPDVLIVDGKRMRYCTNHHLLHDASLFETGTSTRQTSQTTCAHARNLSLARIKRHRGGGGGGSAAAAAEGAAGVPVPSGKSSHSAPLCEPPVAWSTPAQLALPLPLDLWDDGSMDEALFAFPRDDHGPLADELALWCLPTPSQHLALSPPAPPPRLCSSVFDLDQVRDMTMASQQGAVLNHWKVKRVQSQLHGLATSPLMNTFLRCFTGERTKAHARESSVAAAQYAWVKRLFADTIHARMVRLLSTLQERVRTAALHARQTATAGGDGSARVATELVDILERVHSMTTRRGSILDALARRTNFLSPSILLMVEEFREGNAVHLHNVTTLLSILQSAGECGIAEVHAEVVRLVAEFMMVQLGLVNAALAERNTWQEGLARSDVSKADIRLGWDGLWKSVHTWVVPDECFLLYRR